MSKGVIFDVDGTLFETGDGIKHCARYAVKALDLPPIPEEKLNGFIGPSLYHSFTVIAGFPEDVALKAVEIYREIYWQVCVDMSRPYDGVSEMLERLYKNGYTLSIASSKPLVMVNRLLESAGYAKYFTKVMAPDYARKGSDKAELIKSAAVAEKSVMVGDTHFDIDGAHGAGIKAIGVTYGYGERDTLTGAEMLADTPNDVCKLIESGALY